jgi:uncharacterized protein (DUF2267 family)
MALDFNKYAQEGNQFLNHLANKLGHPKEKSQTAIILKAVLHTLRDRLTISESLDLIAQLPMFLKAVYVDNWKYMERPNKLKTIEDFKEEVKKQQEQLGENQFDWKMPTRDIIKNVLGVISENYLSEGEMKDVMAQLPEEMEGVIKESVKS